MPLITENQKFYYLDQETDLTPEMKGETIDTYNAGAEDYASQLAFQPDYLNAVWDDVFQPAMELIRRFKKDSNGIFMFFGDGPLRDSLTAAILNKNLQIYTSDIAENQLKAGMERINWGTILLISTLIYARDRESIEIANGSSLIQAIIHLIHENIGDKTPTMQSGDSKAFEHISPDEMIRIYNANKEEIDISLRMFLRLANAPFSEEYKARQVENVKSRLHIKQGGLEEEVFPGIKADGVFAIATLQHLSKDTDLLPALDNLINTLEVGGTLFFNVRLDMEPTRVRAGEVAKGRVYVDTYIGGVRYYATVSSSEINSLKNAIIRRHPNVLIETGKVSAHPEANKPWFANFRVTRKS